MKGYYIGGIPCLDERDEIYHHGIKGQKWYIRRFQNEDGSLTPAGRERYYGNRGNLQRDLNRLEQGYRRSAMENLKASMRNDVLENKRAHIYRKTTGDPDASQDISDKISRKDAARLDKIGREALKLATTKEKSKREMEEYEKQFWQLTSAAIGQGYGIVSERTYSNYGNPAKDFAKEVGIDTLFSAPLTAAATALIGPEAAIPAAFIGNTVGEIFNTAYTVNHYGDIPYVMYNKYRVVEPETGKPTWTENFPVAKLQDPLFISAMKQDLKYFGKKDTINRDNYGLVDEPEVHKAKVKRIK